MKFQLLLCGALLAVALPAAAAPQVTVSYAGLDFSRREDVAAFNARIDAAADQLCAQATVQPGLLTRTEQTAECRRSARAEAVAQMSEARRFAYLANQPGKPVQIAGR